MEMKSSKIAFALLIIQIVFTFNSVTAVPVEEQPTPAEDAAEVENVCGKKQWKQPTGRIVGGSVTEFAEYPWMTALYNINKTENFYVYRCGASLLNHYWAITAAHCVHDSAEDNVFLIFGDYDLVNENESLEYLDANLEKIFVHPDYDHKAKKNDIALMKLNARLPYMEHVLPICLPKNTQETFAGKTGIASGWGAAVHKGSAQDVLLAVHVPILTNAECSAMYRKSGVRLRITDSLMCAGTAEGGIDACQGDSGGPLMVYNEEQNRYVLAGVTSFGVGCGAANRPGAYSRVTYYLPWITQTMANNS